MNKERITIKEWIEKFKNGEFDNPYYGIQIEAGWYDWFCRKTSLANKTKRMGKIIAKITNEKILNNCYVWFKNNCPMVGPLYDDFRIADLETRDTLFTIVIGDKRLENTYNVFGILNDFVEPLISTSSVKELVQYLNNIEF